MEENLRLRPTLLPKDNPTYRNKIRITKGLTNLPNITYISAREVSKKPCPHQFMTYSADIHERGICGYLSQLGFFLVVNDKDSKFSGREKSFPLCLGMP